MFQMFQFLRVLRKKSFFYTLALFPLAQKLVKNPIIPKN